MIDAKRLAVDAGYWDEVAGTATHYCPLNKQFYDCRLHPCCIPRPQPQPEWVGGLPPAGCECEGRADPGYPWLRGVIMYSSSDGAVFKPNDGGKELFWLYRTLNAEFRPIPTPEQRQREELSKLVRKAYFNVACGHAGGLSAVTEAILSRYTLEPKQ